MIKNGMLKTWIIIPLLLFLFIGLAARYINENLELLESHNQYLLTKLNEANDEIKTIKIRLATIEEFDVDTTDRIDVLISYVNSTREELKADISETDSSRFIYDIGEIWKFLDMLDKRTKFD